MTLLIVSFIAGVLTVLAPCILPLLPIVIGVGASGRSRFTPYIVVGSLALSVIVFTYLLKATTILIMVPPAFWQALSGVIILLVGVTMLFPTLWEKLPLGKLSAKANMAVGAGAGRKSFWGDVMVGAALGPVFSTCSPTYFFILASVLPASFLLGSLYLFSFVLGLSLVLLGIAILGQSFADRLAPLANSRGWFKRAIGAILIILGVLIATGYDKKIETYVIENGWGATGFEYQLLEQADDKKEMQGSTENLPMYREIQNPSGFVNSEPFQLSDLVGEKVILLDFMTYSCINCQRTFPYLNTWYEAYEDQGLVIIGIHTPEFAFEHNIENVQKAAEEFGLEFPLVLDNDYATWRAYGNRYWPRKYLIDIHGRIVYDHIGEGAYEETEAKIQELLKERAEVLAEDADLGEIRAAAMPPASNQARSPETYFGSLRNEHSPQVRGQAGTFDLSYPDSFSSNTLYHNGQWTITPEYAESASIGASITYRYNAKEVYIVAESQNGPVQVEVWQDGKMLGELMCMDGVCEPDARGEDVSSVGVFEVEESRLYKLINNKVAGEHTLELRARDAGVRLFAFTFG